jgi:hypothetical protein
VDLPVDMARAMVGLPPDFLWSLVALANFMRLSLKKAAHAVVSSAAYRKSGSPRLFRPTYAPRLAGAGLANVGHPSYPLAFLLGEPAVNTQPVEYCKNDPKGHADSTF